MIASTYDQQHLPSSTSRSSTGIMRFAVTCVRRVHHPSPYRGTHNKGLQLGLVRPPVHIRSFCSMSSANKCGVSSLSSRTNMCMPVPDMGCGQIAWLRPP